MTVTATQIEAAVPPSLLEELQRAVGSEAVLTDRDERLVYECDAYTVQKALPGAVVFPSTTQQVAEVVRACQRHRTPFVARGAGTGLAGATVPFDGAVVVSLTRMRRIVKVSLRDRLAVVEAGVVNNQLNTFLKGSGFHYAPDPSSQTTCTIGGNVAANAGGPHTLKYGVTTNHVLGVEVVLPDGQVVWFGGECEQTAGYDLRGLFIGSEGTLGICTKAALRLTPDPAAFRTLLVVFESVREATECVSEIIAAGIIPAALELMDRAIVEVVEQAFRFGLPVDAGAVLIVEVDGLEVAVEEEAERVENICRKHRAKEVRRAADQHQRLELWKCRKKAFGAIGRFRCSYFTQDGVVPRTKLPELLDFIAECGSRLGVRIVNVAHAGDGNIHPILLFDERDQQQLKQALKAAEEILSKCVELGGTVTGEHGVGVEKREFMPTLFSENDLAVMKEVRQVFDPLGLCNPGKLLP